MITLVSFVLTRSFTVSPLLTHWAAMRPTYFFYLSNTRRFYTSMGKLCSLKG
jgi:uncharacterized membrane protein